MHDNNLTIAINKKVDSFQLEMLSRNRIPGLLPITQKEDVFLVDTKGYMPLKSYLESHTITVKTFKMLLECFLSIMQDSLLYYLKWSNYELSCDQIYISTDIQSLALIYLPFDEEGEVFNPVKSFVLESLMLNAKFNTEEDWNFMILGINSLNSTALSMSQLEMLHEVFHLRVERIVDNTVVTTVNEVVQEEKVKPKRQKLSELGFLKKIVKEKTDPYLKKEDNSSGGKTILLKRQSAGLKLIPENAKQPEILVSKNNLVLGRHKKSVDVYLKDSSIGKYHAELIFDNDKYYVRDLNSLNGSYLNGEKISSYETKEIRHNDQIAFANINYRVKYDD